MGAAAGENAALVLIGAGTLLGLISYAWLTFLAFKRGFWWGVVLIIFFPLAGCIYAFSEANRKPIYMVWIAGALSAIGMAFLDF
jgi:hypothetical protein